MAVAVRTRPLPGIAFEAEPPPPTRILPRMDITGFVGFAAAGPIGLPVVVEDPAEFEDVFGADAPLAWDGERGERVLAQLAPAVRAFFRNGGRRAWVVRVAAPSAVRSLLPVPGLVARPPGETIRGASLPARACGSWADDVRVGAALTSTPSVLLSVASDDVAFCVEVGAAKIVSGDLLRIGARDFELLVAVESAEPATVIPQTGSPPAPRAPGRTVLTVVGDPATALWLERIEPPYGATGTAGYVDSAGNVRSAAAQVAAPGSPPASPPGSPPEPAATLVLELDAAAAEAPQPGTLVSVEGLSPSPLRVLWLAVGDVGEADGRVHVSGRPTWVRADAPDQWPDFQPGIAVERLTFELWARCGDTDRLVLDDLGFVPGHPRYVGDLPADEELYAERSLDDGPPPELWSVAAHPRFPLAGGPAGTVYYPLGVDVVPRTFLGPLGTPGDALERDGLDRFGDALFLDPDLRSAGLDALSAEAEYIRWQSPLPRRLAGIHALLEVDEATVVSVPDLGQRAWSRAEQPAPPPAPPSAESPPSPPAAPAAEFADCAVHELEPTPQLDLEPPDQGGSFGLVWTTVDEPGAAYELQESTDPAGWNSATTILDGAQTSVRLYGRTAGTYFYRVRARAGQNGSAWSNGVTVVGQPPPGYTVEAEEDYRPNALLAVQRALLRMCAARADLFAVLSLPEHYRADAAIAHAGKLRSAIDPDLPEVPLDPGLDVVLPLDATEARALGFGALYHPWLVLSVPERGDDFRRVPPDGSATGVIARRAATRGAWVAPANEVFSDAVALVHAPPRTGLAALQDAQVNEIRSEPGGFVCLCEDTLLSDDDLRPINVRRLLSLVRRIVMREGVRHVFEPNDPVFRRGVERSLAATMQSIYQLGAFAGATAEQAYRVNAGSPPNTPQTIDEGRLIVEIKLAPSRPLAFLLVRLVASGEQGFQVETP